VQDRRLQHAADVLRRGGIVAYATESCFGLGCDPMNRTAVLRLLRLKRRHVSKGLIVLAATSAQLAPYIDACPPKVARTWPGPRTWLLTARAGVPFWIKGRHPSIAVRVTAHRQAAALCRAAGMAIVSTSANRRGEAPARSYRETQRRLGAGVDYVLPGRIGKLRRPTPITDAASGRVVRAG
jgi:L-threonylcarbamoyladenylate synthase